MAGLDPARAADIPAVRVFVYDYAGVSPAVREGAKATASTIIRRAGVQVEWTECAVRSEETPRVSACGPFTPVDIQLRILNVEMAKRADTTRNCLGYAVTRSGSVAAVYYHRARELSREGLASVRLILGAAMAHEIGHLLLADSGHSPTGVMRGAWNQADLKTLQRGSLRFNEAQAQRLSSMAAKRVERARTAAATLPDSRAEIAGSQ